MALTWGSHGYFPTVMEVSRLAARIRQPYVTDLTDEPWALLPPLIPLAKRGGRPRAGERREVLNTILSLNRTGGQWDLLPHDLLPKSTGDE